MKNSNEVSVANKESIVIKSTVAPTTESVIKRADALVKEREQYETVTLARSNKELYGILGKVHSLYLEASKDIDCLKQTLSEMKAALAVRNIKVQVNSPAITVFVRYVFNSDRKRAYNYTRTLMAAIKANVKPEALADFVEGKGGVEECKKDFSKSLETIAKEQALASAIDTIKAELETMDPTEEVQMPDSSVHLSDDCNYAFVIARIGSGKKLELLRTVPTTTKALENSAIKELAKALIEDEKTAEVDSKVDKKDIASSKALSTMTLKQVNAVIA
jgi:hypothetical protein